MNKTIGILAHVDCGKTTFAEQILYHTKSIRNIGRVDHKNAFLDSHSIEKERGITVFSDQAVFTYNDSTYYLIDTPGHIDFSPEMERSIKAMDYAIVIISGVEGLQGHTETVWQLLRKHDVPTVFFINKIDRSSANVNIVLEEIKNNLTKDLCFVTEELKYKAMNEELIEFVAERDEVLFEKYLQDGYEETLWLNSMRRMIKENKIFPCFSGSALQDIGIDSFLEKLDMLTYTTYRNDEEFSGRVYKIKYGGQGNRVTYIKALSGILKVRDEIKIERHDGEVSEKASQIRIYNGNKFKAVDSVAAGEIFGITGLSSAKIGDGVGTLREKINYEMIPTLKSKVIFDKDLNIKDVLNKFKLLEAEFYQIYKNLTALLSLHKYMIIIRLQ